VEDTTLFDETIYKLKDFWKKINNPSYPIDDRMQYENLLTETAAEIQNIGHFKLSAYTSILSKMCMIKSDRLYLADWRTASKDIKNGSYDFQNKYGNIPDDNNQKFFHNVAAHLGLDARESMGEHISCEANRDRITYDLFYKGETLFHLFGSPLNKKYEVRVKTYDTDRWYKISPLPL